MARIPLLTICGPTASGKTGLAVAVAKALDGEVVSADSMQVYRRMDIGTAKPTAAEMDGVRHHLLDILEPGERFSVAQYSQMARAVIEDIVSRGKLPVLTGGTGLYIDSVTKGIRYAETREDPPLRNELRVLARERGTEHVWEILRKCDPELADSLHPNNLGRVIRGIEVCRTTGVPLSEWQRRSRCRPPEYDLCMLGIRWERQTLYRRIDERVDKMLAQGLLNEARVLYDEGLSGTAAQAIGYKELHRYFKGEAPLQKVVEDIKRESRRYAKRQMTWLRRDERIQWLDAEKYASMGELSGEARRIARNMLGIG